MRQKLDLLRLRPVTRAVLLGELAQVGPRHRGLKVRPETLEVVRLDALATVRRVFNDFGVPYPVDVDVSIDPADPHRMIIALVQP